MSFVPQYPLDKEEAGPHWWAVLHHAALAYPENPDTKDISKFQWFLDTWLKSFPCDTCREHGMDYKRSHPPELSSREGIRQWACEFQNDVRERQGKPLADCAQMVGETTELHDKETCTTCARPQSIQPVQKQQQQQPEEELQVVDGIDFRLPEEPPKIQAAPPAATNTPTGTYYDVSSALNGIKKASRRIVESLCDREGVEPPEIIFQACPTMPDAAECVRLESKQLFINPKRFQLKSVIHGAYHYILAAQGRSELEYGNEEEMDRRAYSVIDNEFRYDKGYYGNQAGKVHYDLDLIPDEHRHIIDEPAPSKDMGILRMFRPAYEPFSGLLQTDADDLNEAHTPEVLGNLAIMLTEWGLSPFGSLLTSTVMSFAFMGVCASSGYYGMNHGDRKLLTHLSAHFLWNGLRYLNPKIMNAAAVGANFAGTAVMRGDLGGVLQALMQPIVPTSLYASATNEDMRAIPIENVEEERKRPRKHGEVRSVEHKPIKEEPQSNNPANTMPYESMAANPVQAAGESAANYVMDTFFPSIGRG